MSTNATGMRCHAGWYPSGHCAGGGPLLRLSSIEKEDDEGKRTPNIITLHSDLFSLQYSSAKAGMDCGLQVSAAIGHPFGQLTALYISGCLSLKDAFELVAGRAEIMPNPGVLKDETCCG